MYSVQYNNRKKQGSVMLVQSLHGSKIQNDQVFVITQLPIWTVTLSSVRILGHILDSHADGGSKERFLRTPGMGFVEIVLSPLLRAQIQFS